MAPGHVARLYRRTLVPLNAASLQHSASFLLNYRQDRRIHLGGDAAVALALILHNLEPTHMTPQAARPPAFPVLSESSLPPLPRSSSPA